MKLGDIILSDWITLFPHPIIFYSRNIVAPEIFKNFAGIGVSQSLISSDISWNIYICPTLNILKKYIPQLTITGSANQAQEYIDNWIYKLDKLTLFI